MLSRRAGARRHQSNDLGQKSLVMYCRVLLLPAEFTNTRAIAGEDPMTCHYSDRLGHALTKKVAGGEDL
jgi:hypothetical protein